MEKKIASPIDVLCKGLPDEFSAFINYTRDLKFDDRPDYGYLRRLLKTIADKDQIQYDYMFDWVIKKKEQEQEETKEEVIITTTNNNNNNSNNIK